MWSNFHNMGKVLKLLSLTGVPLLFICSIAVGQVTVSGTVTDSTSGETLPGVNILVKGSTNLGTATSLDGTYSLNVPSLQDTLIFRFVGYNVKEVPINGRTTLNVALAQQVLRGEDVVVVGYGTQSTREISGSVQNIETEQLSEIPATQFTQKLQGKLAGVNITQTTGRPGEGVEVKIRGSASISTGTEPLYIVDGIPLVGGIEDIPSSEVESISVLKDAAATASYGSRAANGVVIIETKKARPGETQIDVNLQTGFQQVPGGQNPDMMNARQYAEFQRQIDIVNNRPVDPIFQNPEQFGKGTDWWDEMIKRAPFNSHDITIRTGTENFSTSNTVGYLNQDGVVVGTGFERINFRTNNDIQPTENLRININLAPSINFDTNGITDGRPFESGSLAGALLTTPIAPVRNENGELTLTAEDPATFGNPNFVRDARDTEIDNREFRMLGSSFIEYELTNTITLKTAGYFELGRQKNFRFEPSTTGDLFEPPPNVPEGRLLDREFGSWTMENTINYNNDIGDHSINFTAGITGQSFGSELTDIVGTNFPDDKIEEIAEAQTTNISSDVQEWTLLSYLGKWEYDYKDKYLATVSFRRDGSSRFGSDNRWGNFPSFSLGWVLTEEEWLEIPEFVSFFKLRGSWGIVGNFNIGNFSRLSTITTDNFASGEGLATGRALDNLGNEDLGWEVNRMYNAGFDINLLNDRVNLTYETYRKNTRDLLFDVDIPTSSGFESVQENIGHVTFWGHEVQLAAQIFNKSNFRWNIDANWNFNRNRVKALGTNNSSLFSGTDALGNTNATIVGKPIGMLYGLKWLGLFETQEELEGAPQQANAAVGTARFADINGDGVITNGGDNTIIGNPHPDWTLGLTNSFTYKNFDISMVVTASEGADIMRVSEQFLANLDGVFNALEAVKNRFISPEQPGNGRFGTSLAGTTFPERDYWNSRMVFDGTNLTIRNITVGYTFPFRNQEGIGSFLNRLRVYGSVRNAFIITSFPGNPEVNTADDNVTGDTVLGIDETAFPVPRIVTFGAQIRF